MNDIDEILIEGFRNLAIPTSIISTYLARTKPSLQAREASIRIDELNRIKARAMTNPDTGVQWTVPCWAIDDRIKELEEQ